MTCHTEDHFNVGGKLVYIIINRDSSVRIRGGKTIINFDYSQSTQSQEGNKFLEENVLAYHFYIYANTPFLYLKSFYSYFC